MPTIHLTLGLLYSGRAMDYLCSNIYTAVFEKLWPADTIFVCLFLTQIHTPYSGVAYMVINIPLLFTYPPGVVTWQKTSEVIYVIVYLSRLSLIHTLISTGISPRLLLLECSKCSLLMHVRASFFHLQHLIYHPVVPLILCRAISSAPQIALSKPPLRQIKRKVIAIVWLQIHQCWLPFSLQPQIKGPSCPRAPLITGLVSERVDPRAGALSSTNRLSVRTTQGWAPRRRSPHTPSLCLSCTTLTPSLTHSLFLRPSLSDWTWRVFYFHFYCTLMNWVFLSPQEVWPTSLLRNFKVVVHRVISAVLTTSGGSNAFHCVPLVAKAIKFASCQHS